MQPGVSFAAYSQGEGLSGNRVRVIYEDSHGTLWVGTDNDGLNRLEGDTFTYLEQQHGLSNDSVRALVEDHEGSLWVGTFGGGLNRLKDDRYIFYNTRNGLPVDMTRAVMQDRQGDLLDRHHRRRPGALQLRQVPGFRRRAGTAPACASGPSPRATTAPSGSAPTAAACTACRTARSRVYSTRNGMANDIVRAILAARDGSIWAGTNGGGIDILHPDGRIVNYSRRNGLGDDFIYAIAQDREGAVWVGTYNGELYRFRGEEITTFRPHGPSIRRTPSGRSIPMTTAPCGSAPTAAAWSATRTASSAPSTPATGCTTTWPSRSWRTTTAISG